MHISTTQEEMALLAGLMLFIKATTWLAGPPMLARQNPSSTTWDMMTFLLKTELEFANMAKDKTKSQF